MSRVIKFRAWHKEKKIFIEPIVHNGKVFEDMQDFFDNASWINHDIQQFTGLLDKHGKPIYEGDILRINDPEGIEDGDIFEIKWVDKWMCFTSSISINNEHNSTVEIIGNIHENPELMEE